jgi:hypothetical protein
VDSSDITENDIHETSSVNDANMTKKDEILKIMRKHFIDRELSCPLTILFNSLLLAKPYILELKKMKEDYYYNSDPNKPQMIPGPSWELKGPFDFHKIKNNFYVPEGMENPFMVNYKDGDVLYYYRSNKASWGYLCGEGGYVLIRDKEVVDIYIMELN